MRSSKWSLVQQVVVKDAVLDWSNAGRKRWWRQRCPSITKSCRHRQPNNNNNLHSSSSFLLHIAQPTTSTGSEASKTADSSTMNLRTWQSHSCKHFQWPPIVTVIEKYTTPCVSRGRDSLTAATLSTATHSDCHWEIHNTLCVSRTWQSHSCNTFNGHTQWLSLRNTLLPVCLEGSLTMSHNTTDDFKTTVYRAISYGWLLLNYSLTAINVYVLLLTANKSYNQTESQVQSLCTRRSA